MDRDFSEKVNDIKDDHNITFLKLVVLGGLIFFLNETNSINVTKVVQGGIDLFRESPKLCNV